MGQRPGLQTLHGGRASESLSLFCFVSWGLHHSRDVLASYLGAIWVRGLITLLGVSRFMIPFISKPIGGQLVAVASRNSSNNPLLPRGLWLVTCLSAWGFSKSWILVFFLAGSRQETTHCGSAVPLF